MGTRSADIPAAGEVVKLEDGSVTVWLSKPVKIDGEETLSVTLRPATGKDVRSIKAGGEGIELGEFMDLGGRLCGLLPGQLDAMPAQDALAIQGVAQGFFVGS